MTPLVRCNLETIKIEGSRGLQIKAWPIIQSYHIVSAKGICQEILPDNWQEIHGVIERIESHRKSKGSFIGNCKLNHFILKVFGLDYLGILDYPLTNELLGISPELSFAEAREQLTQIVFNAIRRQVLEGGTTIGLDVDRIIKQPELLDVVDDIVRNRKKEIQSVAIGPNRDLMPLWFTAHGFRILSSLGVGKIAKDNELKVIAEAFKRLGLEFEISSQEKYSSTILSDDAKKYITWLVEKGKTNCLLDWKRE